MCQLCHDRPRRGFGSSASEVLSEAPRIACGKRERHIAAFHGSRASLIARAMNADDAAELLRRLQALEMELNRRPTVEAVQAEIARQLNTHAGNLEAIRLAIERLGAADGHRPTAGQHVKPKDLMPKDWAGDVGDAQGFSEFAFKKEQ